MLGFAVGRGKGAKEVKEVKEKGTEEDDENEQDKIIVRSGGTVTYVGKDIAYQLWKFGLLGKDFYYRPLKTYEDGRVVYVTTDEPLESGQQFGHASRVYNVIDERQSYLRDVVVRDLLG